MVGLLITDGLDCKNILVVVVEAGLLVVVGVVGLCLVINLILGVRTVGFGILTVGRTG